MRSLIIFMLACAGTVAPVTKMQAQQLPQQPAVLTLQQALDTARANYPAIRAAQLNIEQQQALEKTAWQLGSTQVFTGKEEVGNGNPGVQTVVGIQQQNIDLLGGFSRSKWRNELIWLSEANRQDRQSTRLNSSP